MSVAPEGFNATVIAEFRANAGRVGGSFEGTPLLLVRHRGAKSGHQYVNPLIYLLDGARYVTFAANAGAPTAPGWYYNLRAHPEVTIEVGAETLAATASVAEGSERDRLYERQVAATPRLAEFQEMAERQIPVVVLTPRLR